MPEKVVCRSCGAEMNWPVSSAPVASAAPAPASPQVANKSREPVLQEGQESGGAILRRLMLTLGYLLAAAGVSAFFMVGPGFPFKSSIFFWPIDPVRGSALRLLENMCLPASILPLAFVVAAALVAVRLRALIIGMAIAALAVGVFVGVLQLRKEADWQNLAWFYNVLTAGGLLAILVGLAVSKKWLALALVVPAVAAAALAGLYFNHDQNRSVVSQWQLFLAGANQEWASFFAGTFHGLVIGLAAWLMSWIMNRHAASTLLGACIGALLGMYLADTTQLRGLLQTPEFKGWPLPVVSLFLEVSLAFVLALVTGLIGRRDITPLPTVGQRRKLSVPY
jgi:hypothetical protein